MDKALVSHQEFRWSIRKKGKHVFNLCMQYFRLHALAVALVAGTSGLAYANPTDGVVAAGSATITSAGTEVDINQTSNKAIINWGSFDIASGETTKFIQPGASSLTLNRVTTSGQASSINGNLIANGHVLVINPNGVLIGPNGNVDVAGFVASSADVDDGHFMTATGAVQFNKAGNQNAVVENQGHITVKDAGLGLLVAPTVKNSGVIEGNLARLQMGAGDTFGVDFYGDGLLNLAVSTSGVKRSIGAHNSGNIIASGGKVLMTAAAASDVVDSVINTTGVVKATSLVSRGGEIILTGAGAHVKVAGKVDASGKTGGGRIRIGGDAKGADTLAKAATVEIDNSAVISANSNDTGNGGDIAVWSEAVTISRGRFEAKGGANGGDGGLIETSGKNILDVAGTTIDTTAAQGALGTWLLDPTTLTVDAALAATISASLGNVALTTTDGAIIAADISMVTAGADFSLTAGAGGISASNNYLRTNGGDVTFLTTGAISLNKYTMYTRGGNVSLTGDSISINNNAAIGTGGGAVAGNVLLLATSTGGGNTISINNSRIDTSGGSTLGGLFFRKLDNSLFTKANGDPLLTDADKESFFGNTANHFDTSKFGGSVTIKGKSVGGNSNCINAGGALACGVVNDPIPGIDLTVTADPKTKVYGTTDPLLTYTYTGTLQGTDSFSGALTRVAGENVGDYNILQGTLTVIGSYYTYVITYIGSTLTITPALLSITAQDQSKTYGQLWDLGTTGFTTSGLKFSDTVTGVTLASAGTPVSAGVGAYGITASNALGTGLGNYTITYLPGTLTVNPANLTVTASNQSKTYGSTFTFNGTEFTTSGLLNTDTVTSASIASAGSAATATVAGSPYAITIGSALGSGLGNYNISYVNGAFTVNPANLTVTASNQSKTYGSTFTFNGTEFTTSGLLNSDTVTSASLASSGAAATATVAGSPYAITIGSALGSGLGNYNISYVNGAFTVNPANLTVTASNQSKTYGSTFTFNGTEFTTSGLLNSDTVTSASLASSGAAATATVAGSPYAITIGSALGSGLGNYNITYAPGSFTVNPANLTVTANNQSKTYGSAFTFNGTEFTTSGLLNTDTVTSASLASSGAAATATVAGSPYAITIGSALGSGLGNYNISYVNGAFTVNPANLTVTASNQSKTYGSTFTFNGTEFTTSGLLNSDTVTSASLASSGAAATATVAGSPYAITIGSALGSGLGNYNISYVNGSFTVNPANLTVTASNQTKTYGSTFTFNGTEFTTSGLLNSDSVTSASLASSGAAATATVAGSPYAITIGSALGSGLGNYAISYVNGAFTVNPANLTVTASNQSKTYGSTFTFNGTEFTTSGLLNTDTVTSASLASAGSAATATVAGSPYAITIGSALGSGLGNYNISYVNGSFTVNPANLTVTASNQTKTYGSTFTFNGTEFTTSGLLNSDTVTSASIASAGSAATATIAGSPYAITIGSALGSGLGNYNISYVNGAFTVNPANLTVTASNQTKTYGSTFTFNGTEFTTSGLLNTDTVTSASLASSGAAATATVAGSPYAITIGSALGSGLGNYNISYVNGAFTVNPANLTVTASNQSKTYGSTFTFNGTEFTTSGLLNSDTVTSASLASAGAAASATIAGSPYAITIGSATGSGLGNYNISYVNGTLSITPYALTVTALDQSKIYGSTFTFNGTEFSTAGLLNGDTVTSASLSSTGSSATATVAGSPYAITIGSAVGTGLGNYTITYVNGNMAVTPKALTVTALGQTKVYGSTFTFDGTEFSTSGLVNSDAVTSASLASSGSAATATVAGSPYSIDISGASGSGLGNYTITYVNGNLAVTPKALTVTALDQSKIYGSTFTFDGTEFSTSGLVNSDAVTSASLSSSGADASATVAGSPYSIDISGASGSGLGNYTISYVNGNLAVTPKALTVTALDQSKIYGSTFTFDGTEFSTSGLVNSDAVTSASLSSTGADASATVAGSPYSIDISGASGSGLGNYTISYVNGNLAVTPKALTVTALDQSKVYGSTFTFHGTEFSTSGLVNGDAVDSASLSSTGADASATVAGSSYSIDISGAAGSGLGNYTISYVNGNLAVTPARLTVTALDQSKVYGSTFTFDGTEFSTSGLVNGDAVDSASLSSSGADASATVAGSPYSIDISGASGSGLDNYTITYVNGNLAVTPKALTLTANDQSKTAGTNFLFLGTEFTSDGLVNGDSVSGVDLASLGAPASAPSGGYEITIGGAQGEGLGNYEIAYVPGTLTVDAAVVTPFVDIDPLGRPIISVADQVLVYNAPFEQIETLNLNTDVSIKASGTPGETSGGASASDLANIQPAAGGDDDANAKKKKKGKGPIIAGTTAQDLANVEPAAGGTGAGGTPAAGGDIGCANDFLDNKPCAAQ